MICQEEDEEGKIYGHIRVRACLSGECGGKWRKLRLRKKRVADSARDQQEVMQSSVTDERNRTSVYTYAHTSMYVWTHHSGVRGKLKGKVQQRV